MATYTEATSQQSTNEIRKWTVDFSNDLPTGVTVSSGTATHIPPSGSAAAVVVTAATPKITTQIGPLTVTGQHYLDVTATFSNAEKSDVRIAFTVNYPSTSAREGMLDMISDLRQMTDAGVNDYSIAGVPYWQDAQLQRVMDKHRVDFRFQQIKPEINYASAGSVSYTTYYIGYGNIESGTAVFTVEDGTGADVGTASWTADYQNGIIIFGADTTGSAYYVTGRRYDLNAAAADIWRMKAANAAKVFDFSTDNHSMKRSQLMAQCKEMAVYYAGMAEPTSISLYRSDYNG